MPKDQNSRSAALTLMINAIALNDFGTKEYGTDFWTDIKARYDVLLTNATTTDSQVASKFGTNSSQYEMAGGVRKSERKKPKRSTE